MLLFFCLFYFLFAVRRLVVRRLPFSFIDFVPIGRPFSDPLDSFIVALSCVVSRGCFKCPGHLAASMLGATTTGGCQSAA